MIATKQPTVDNLPKKAMNLARRVHQIVGRNDGRYIFELGVRDGKWELVVKTVERVEDLGNE